MGLCLGFTLPFLCPCLSPPVSGGWGGGTLACYVSTARVQGALKKVEEEEEGEDAWESWHCCRVNGAPLSQEPFSGFPEVPVPTPPPTQYNLLPLYTKKHIKQLALSLLMLHIAFFLFYSLFSFCLIHPPMLLLSPHFKQTDMACPSSCLPPGPHYFASLMWLSCCTDSKSWKHAILSFTPPLSYPILSKLSSSKC